jgi:hypothetical protein
MDKPLVILAGDSIIANESYVGKAQDTVSKVEARFKHLRFGEVHGAEPIFREWARTDVTVESLAQDGATAEDTLDQLDRYHTWHGSHGRHGEDVQTVVISCGGNDALQSFLRHAEDAQTDHVTINRHVFRDEVERFRSEYAQVLDAAIQLVRDDGPTDGSAHIYALAIYNADFADPELRTLAQLVAAQYNDAIYRECARASLPVTMKVGDSLTCPVQVIDLRDHCMTDEHFTNEIEPSGVGSQAIADAIVHAHMFGHAMKTSRPLIHQRSLNGVDVH